jgi:hypothetical protein
MIPHADCHSDIVSGIVIDTKGMWGIPTVFPTKCRDFSRFFLSSEKSYQESWHNSGIR